MHSRSICTRSLASAYYLLLGILAGIVRAIGKYIYQIFYKLVKLQTFQTFHHFYIYNIYIYIYYIMVLYKYYLNKVGIFCFAFRACTNQ